MTINPNDFRISGIYLIRNKKTKTNYVGATKDVLKRFNDHFFALKRNKHCNKMLQKDWNKYGSKNFSFRVLEKCKIKALKGKELFYANKHKSHQPNGYNLLIGYR